MEELVTTLVVARDQVDQLASSLPRHRGRVVLVDDGSQDGTAGWVRRRHPSVQLLALPQSLGPLARNVGVRFVDTPYVALADADSWWDPGALDLAAMYLQTHDRLAILAGDLVGGPEEVAPAWPRVVEPDLPGPTLHRFAPEAVVLRCEAFLAVGGFRPPTVFQEPDQQLVRDLAASGWGTAHVCAVTARRQEAEGGTARRRSPLLRRRRPAGR